MGGAFAASSCIDPALSAQLMLLRRMPRQGFACSAPDEGAGGYRNRSVPDDTTGVLQGLESMTMNALVLEGSDGNPPVFHCCEK
jgi:hypothetical protein